MFIGSSFVVGTGRNDTVSALYARIATGSIVLAGWLPSPKGLPRASLEFRGGGV
ncbi:hypothetical protein [Nitrosomonas sp. Nm33]|uniref:hypothetical protein n=1 Tax=Nitrosomonas sp. Nm33 TaxID=133724 RepID=UPI0015A3EC5A|nr:hypothetical protein [Nitrosomonas sp. Nm33]